MKQFSDLLIEESIKKESVLVVGLDPQVNNMPNYLINRQNEKLNLNIITNAILNFNKTIIDVVHPYVVAVKPQLAYYEIYGSLGLQVLEQTISYAKSKGLLVINDAKRGDIGSTATAYAQAFLGNSPINGDAVTVNPFLGSDGITPFINESIRYQKGLFILLKTSNPSAYELQDLELKSGDLVYNALASLIKKLSSDTITGKYGYSSIGAVVGATYPNVAKNMREILPKQLFLVPGFGAQGGDTSNLKYFFNADGNGSIITSSRGIIYSYKNELPEKWETISKGIMEEIIEATVIRARDEINSVR
ncbi:orotidine-5'-phosphate decarboxylase [Bacillus solimangrovi]|uniref:Orotidine 5'-phosphate decarboxylase n=1 Tax=Bacillus solimangrovi TaxID=1305675 RepID=A0A1E5LJL7_9BACI|nr:orotidine-5'-phosphate decarboxylase [Bacillus solimangrovi]OEH94280.1 orotidine 5'-phosphate decarboxylase [Bacillus solimangrovi]